jgi:hypothetical protein
VGAAGRRVRNPISAAEAERLGIRVFLARAKMMPEKGNGSDFFGVARCWYGYIAMCRVKGKRERGGIMSADEESVRGPESGPQVLAKMQVLGGRKAARALRLLEPARLIRTLAVAQLSGSSQRDLVRACPYQTFNVQYYCFNDEPNVLRTCR